MIHGDDQDSVDDEISDEGRRYKVLDFEISFHISVLISWSFVTVLVFVSSPMIIAFLGRGGKSFVKLAGLALFCDIVQTCERLPTVELFLNFNIFKFFSNSELRESWFWG